MNIERLLAGSTGLLLVLVTLPGTLELALLTFAALLPGGKTRSHSNAHHGRGQIKRLAVVIPAHNEATTITRCVRSVLQCEQPIHTRAFTIVVADNCTDTTAELASGAGARVLERLDNEHRGKGFALEFAFRILLKEGFEAVVVLDADSLVKANFLIEVVRLLDLGADGVQAGYLPLNRAGSARGSLRNLAVGAFNVLRPLGRDRLGLSCGITGNGFALTRATLEAVPYNAESIVEDLEYHLSLVRAGRRIVFTNRTIVEAEMPITGAAAATQRARWEGGRARMIANKVPMLSSAAVQNPRLTEPLLELLLFPLTIHVSLLTVALALPFRPAQIYSAFALALVAVHVCAGAKVAGGGMRDFRGLLALPAYFAWKLTLIPATLRSARSNAEWRRTERE